MTILCATDFTPSALEASRVAAAFALRSGQTMVLVHARSTAHSTIELMAHAADAVRAMGVSVSERIGTGAPETVIAEAAADVRPTLLFLGASSGQVARRVARTTRVPMFTIRDGARLTGWMNGGAPLRVVIATDLSSASQDAVDHAASLQRIGPIDAVLFHAFWPPEEHERLQLSGPIFHAKVHPVVRDVLERELRAQARVLENAASVRTEIQANLGRPADALREFARREAADLLVIGAHRRRGFDRLLSGSVSESVVGDANLNVLCVPLAEATIVKAIAPPKRILVAADFSATADFAIAHACSIAPPGSTVIVLHVARSGADRNEHRMRALSQRLAERIPPVANSRVTTEVQVVAGTDVAATITATAERLGADIVVVGTEGRGGVARPIFGSVAQAVMLRSRHPVLVVPPARVLATRTLPYAAAEAVPA